MNIIDQYKNFVIFLGEVLSDNYEIALLDLRDGVRCITAISHGHVTGRQAGAPITDFALKIVSQEEWKKHDYLVNYTGMSSGNNYLRSSSFFIKENEELLGMLCINVDTKCYTQICSQILSLGGLNISENQLQESSIEKFPENPSENFVQNLSDSIDTILNNATQSLDQPVERLTQDEKVEFLKNLSKTGLFLMKGSIPAVAQKMQCSEASVYRYLSKLK